MNNLSGKRALITGAGKRVGRAIALALADAGADIVVHYHTSSRESDEVAAEVLSRGRRADTICGDLADPAKIDLMVNELNRHEIAVDILVNSASVYFPTTLGEITADHWDRIMAVNARAPFLLSQKLGMQMKARGDGLIINIADCNLDRPYRNYTPYFMSKAALHIMTETLALELSPEVRVNTISPGTVLVPDDAGSDFYEQAINRSPLKTEGRPEDIAQMVAYLAQHGRFITGSDFRVDGGATVR